MKTFTFIYDPRSTPKNSLALMKKAIQSGVPHVEVDQMKSPSLKALLSVATENRLEMFKVIHDQKPASLYELAQTLKKDPGYISKEVRVLEEIGLVEVIKESSSGREKLRPVAKYDRIILDFDLALKKAVSF